MKLCNDYENGGLKSVDIFSKIVSLQCSWIKRLDDENFHPWKIIPLCCSLVKILVSSKFRFKKLLCKNFSGILKRNNL